MSFHNDAKQELLDSFPRRACCKQAEAFGLVLCGRHFSVRHISHKTDTEALALRYRSLVKKAYGITCETGAAPRGDFVVSVPADEVPALYETLAAHTLFDSGLFGCAGCVGAFLRGVFLVSGFVSDPQREYHLELTLRDEKLSWDICRLMNENGLQAKTTERRGQFVVYIKESESMEDLLTMMGATRASLAVMNIKIMKEFRNNANRITNFETANIQKTAKASAKYLTAIEVLEQNGRLQTLPPELQQAALARREHYELSLSELGALLGLSRSGIYHRLEKLAMLAKEMTSPDEH